LVPEILYFHDVPISYDVDWENQYLVIILPDFNHDQLIEEVDRNRKIDSGLMYPFGWEDARRLGIYLDNVSPWVTCAIRINRDGNYQYGEHIPSGLDMGEFIVKTGV
jgi:hypothetical protein